LERSDVRLLFAANGVKQGGVLSPVLFCIYIDGLLVLLAKAGCGCYIGKHFMGTLAYADDIVLLAPSPTALRKMLEICDTYALDYNICFNAKKSKCLIVAPYSQHYLRDYYRDCTFCIGNNSIETVDSFSHLGHVITDDLDDSKDIENKCHDLMNRTNNVLCYFRNMDSCVQYRLFKSFCMSLYGCELWSLSSKAIINICVAWRKCVRRVWDLPHNTHCQILPLLCNSLPILDEVCKRCLNFLHCCINSEFDLVRFAAMHGAKFGRSLSPIGHNTLFCINRYRSSLYDLFSDSRKSIISEYYTSTVSDEIMRKVEFLEESLSYRDALFRPHISGCLLSRSEIQDIISFLCTD
jgi:hypothetical protein